tara:strand:+ start:22266 stop:25559 length:3294 start_codon:yes stop_codon:yes gene_type:complete
MTSSNVSVMAAPLFDPGMARVSLDVPPGLTIDEIVTRVLPHARPASGLLRVILVNDRGASVAEEKYWSQMRPTAGTHVVIRTIPGKNALRSVLLAVVSVASLAFAPTVAGFLGVTSKLSVALVGAGLSIVGQLLVNALIPVQTPDALEKKNVYSIEGWRNELRPGSPVPFAVGKHRYAPPFAAQTYTEVTGDEQYVRALFCFGYGPLRITDLRIGDTSVTDFEDIDIEIREGREGDDPIGLYPQQVLQENDGAELVRPLPRDVTGEVISGAAGIETPVIRFSSTNAARVSVILGFPGGLFSIDNKGRLNGYSVSVRIRARLNGIGVWTEVVTLNVNAAKQESFLRQHNWDLPTRGRWQIEVTRMSEDNLNTQVSDKVVLSAIQSIRPEYPINLDTPLALVAIRVRATYQLSGPLNAFNALIEREAQVYVDDAWVAGYGRTPATAYLAALTGTQNPYPATEAEIDMDQIANWHDWCVLKRLKYDRVHDTHEALGEMLNAICAAGRATPRHDGTKWGVVIDRPETLVIDHINPRNSDQFEWSRSYFDAPDGMRITFLDETNDYVQAERIVPWPGHEGPVNLTEAIELPGKTDPGEIWIEARRRMYELQYRADSFSAMQSGRARVVTRGDLVMGSFDVLSRTLVAARVTSISGNLIEIDEEVLVGENYGVRFRTYGDEYDVIGISTVRPIGIFAEASRALMLTGSGPAPSIGELIHIGPIATESLALRVRGIEAAEDFQARILMVAAAPEIDTLTDAEVPPAWDGRVGAEVDMAAVVPAAPLFASIASGTVGTGDVNGLKIILRPGTGSTATVTGFELDHRIVGSGIWTTISIPAAASGAAITAYTSGDDVELRARALASTTPGNYTEIATVTIGGNDPAIPSALHAGAVMADGSLGNAFLTISVPTAEAPSQLQLYRAPSGSALDLVSHRIGDPIGVSPGSTVSYVDGDSTRTNLVKGDAFTLGAGWTVASGKATHAPGSAGSLSQAVTFEAGKTYRTAFTVLDYTAGIVTPRLSGGTTVNGGAVGSAGLVFDRLSAVAGNTDFEIYAASDFDGAIDDLLVFVETPGCVDAGQWDYWISPQNSENIAGPIAGPFTVTIY